MGLIDDKYALVSTGICGPSKTRTSGNFLKPESKNTQGGGGGGDAPPAGSPLHSVGRMSVMWLLLDGKN